MKLVIEIDDTKYKWICENPLVYTDYKDEVIRNAIPLTDCTDAISRSAVVESALNVPIAPIVDGDKVTVRQVVFLEDVLSLPSVNPLARPSDEQFDAFGKKILEQVVNIDNTLAEIRAEIIDKYITADGRMGSVSADILKIIDKYSKGGE